MWDSKPRIGDAQPSNGVTGGRMLECAGQLQLGACPTWKEHDTMLPREQMLIAIQRQERQFGFWSCWFIPCPEATDSMFLSQEGLLVEDKLDFESQKSS